MAARRLKPFAEPERRCVGCGQSAPKGELLRFVRRADGLAGDPDGRAAGRGAYLHPSADCAAAAVRRRGFERSLRASVPIPPDLLESLG